MYGNITCVDYGILINGSKSNVGVVCMLMTTPTIQHLCCTLIEIPQSTHVMLSYLRKTTVQAK